MRWCLRKNIQLPIYLFLLKNHVCSELYLKYLKMVATVADQSERSAGKEVNRDIRITTVNVGTMRGSKQ